MSRSVSCEAVSVCDKSTRNHAQGNRLAIRLNLFKKYSFTLSPTSSEQYIDDYFNRQLLHRCKPLHSNSWIHLALVKLAQPSLATTQCGSSP